MVLINSVLDVHEIIIFKKISVTQKLRADYQLEKDVLLMYLTKHGKEGATPSDNQTNACCFAVCNDFVFYQ